MRVEVLENFYDNEMKTLHIKGDIFEVSEKRAVQIRTVLSNHIIEVQEAKEEIDLDAMTKKELIAYAESKGIELDSKLNKAQMIEKLEV